MIDNNTRKIIEDIKNNKDNIHKIEYEWILSFETKFNNDIDPCYTSMLILDDLHKKATNPDWKPIWAMKN